MSSPAPSLTGSTKKRFSLGRTLSKRWGSKRNLRDSAPLQDEQPLVVLRVQVLACKNLAAADRNGKSDPYVVLTFQTQRKKTPVVHKSLDPVYQAKDATFDFPVYKSVVERLGTLLEIVVWDKDLLGKDYLAELPLTCSDWFAHNAAPAAYDFASPKNHSFWRDLQSSRTRREAQGAIHVKIGFVAPPATKSVDFAALFSILSKHSRGDIFSSPATKGVGTLGDSSISIGRLNEDSDDEDSEDDTASARTLVRNLPSFRLNWEGTKVDYSFSQHKEISGILLLEIKSAMNLPKKKDLGKSGFECDPCVVITFGKRTLRTRVIRHTLEPMWNERLILIVPREDAGSSMTFSVLNWDTVTGENTLGQATLNVDDIATSAPHPNARTGLYTTEASLSHGMREFKLPLAVPTDSGLDTKSSPFLVVSAKFEHHAAFRQRFWRAHLHEFDKDSSGTFSRQELSAFLTDSGIDLEASKIDTLFSRSGKDPRNEQLTLDEAVVALEMLIGVPPLASSGPADAIPAPKAIEAPSPGTSGAVSTFDSVAHAVSVAHTVEPTAQVNEDGTNRNAALASSPETCVLSTCAASPGKPAPLPHADSTAKSATVEEHEGGQRHDSWVQVSSSVVADAKLAVLVAELDATGANPDSGIDEPASVPASDSQEALSRAPEATPRPREDAPITGATSVTAKPTPQAHGSPPVPARREITAAQAEFAASYAALILADAALEITAEHLTAILSAVGVCIEPFWADVFARACGGRDIKTALVSACGAVGQQVAAVRPDATAQVKEHVAQSDVTPPQAAPAEESDEDMGFGLFD